MDGTQANKSKELYVVKHNDLIRARYHLTTQQQKIILFAISKIKPNDEYGKWYEISIEELCNACGLIIDDTGYYYKSIKDDLRSLTSRLWVKLPDRREITVSWISDAEIIPLNGTVQIRFHEKLEPYLFNLVGLGRDYTQYKLENVLIFKNRYAIRLFELLKMRLKGKPLNTRYTEEVDFSVKELREELGVEGYPIWGEFERCVLRKAVKEINEYSDIFRIAYETQKNGKATERIIFLVKKPDGMERALAHDAIRDRDRESIHRKPSKKTREKQEKLRQLAEKQKEVEEQIAHLAPDSPLLEAYKESKRLVDDLTGAEREQLNVKWEGQKDG